MEGEGGADTGASSSVGGDGGGVSLFTLAEALRENVQVKDRVYHLQTYKNCFLGTEAVAWMIESGMTKSEEDAVALGRLLEEAGHLDHVMKDHPFMNKPYFYRFSSDMKDHGHALDDVLSWDHLSAVHFQAGGVDEELQSSLEGLVTGQEDLRTSLQKVRSIGVTPLDEHNINLLNNVHPAKWVDPNPSEVYNLVVIGAGTGGLVSAAGSAGVLAKVAIIEEHLMGGDCLNVGCVPSKALLAAANVAHTVMHRSGDFGVFVDRESVRVDFAAVMKRMRKIRAQISDNDSFKRFSSALGVDVFQGRGSFVGPDRVEVNGKILRFKRAVIATGGGAIVPDIPGLSARDGADSAASVPYLTNSSIFNLTKLPARLLVIGGGPIGLELAQAMQRFGSRVRVLIRGSRILPKEDDDAREVVLSSMRKDGVEFEFGLNFCSVEFVEEDITPASASSTTSADPHETFKVCRVFASRYQKGGEEQLHFEGEALLLATGRSPNVHDMGLEEAGVEFDARNGIVVNDYLQTTNKNVYAVGDCCSKYQFTHAADAMARIVIRNALFFGKSKVSNLLIPHCTYTEPEVAHVGLYPRDMEERKTCFRTFKKEMAGVDRAICEGEVDGFVKIHVAQGSDKILGCTIVGPRAGDMISEVTVAIQNGVGLGKLPASIHPYPTIAASIAQTGDLCNQSRLTPSVKGLFRALMAFRRK